MSGASDKPNLLIFHGGGPTPVINASLYGVVREAVDSGQVGRVLAGVHGVPGVLADRVVELDRLPDDALETMRVAPGSAIGSSRHKLTDDDKAAVLSFCRRRNVRWLLGNGGNDTMSNCHDMHEAAARSGQDLAVVGIPKTIDNDLAETDHCPGYGSAARYLAQAAHDLCCDVSSLPTPVSILETMGRNTGWLCASTALARTHEGDGPHLIYLPERAFDADRFLTDVEDTVRRHGWAVVATSEGLVDAGGSSIAVAASTVQTDGFGHGMSGGVASVLQDMVSGKLGLRCRYEKPGLLGRASTLHVSDLDRREAEAVGRKAVRLALEGQSGVMVTILVERNPGYRWTTGTAPLARVANIERTMPPEFLSPDAADVTEAFLDYARPLLGGELQRHQHVRRLP